MNKWLIDLAKNIKKDNTDTLISWPKTIVQQYAQLWKVAEEGNLYGVLLQAKDLFEEIIKLPTVMAVIVLDSLEGSLSDEKNIAVAKKLLSQPMTMGSWYSLALYVVKKQKDLSIPTSLASILKKTTILFQQSITDEITDIVNWRNNSIGHGALRFSESDSYKEELKSIFRLLLDYVDGNTRYSVNGLYENIILRMETSDNNLEIDGISYRFGSFAAQIEAKTYLFESYYSNKRMTKFQSESGGQLSRHMLYFDDLFQICFRQNTSQESIRADFISRENDLLLEYLNNPETYIKPKYIVDRLQTLMDEMGKGVILIRMERGTGKTAFASRMDGLYNSKKECLIPEAFARCYHVSNVDLKGIEDYYHSFNYSFKHSYSHADDIRESGSETIDISRTSPQIDADIAEALERYHEWYGREYTVFIVDGIDEMSDKSKEIFRTIPNKNQLADGTFILLLSRFEDEETVDENAIRNIKKAISIADQIVDVRRKTEENTSLMLKYVCSCDQSYTMESAQKIVEKSDYRMLFVKPYLVLPPETVRAYDEMDLVKTYYDQLSLHLTGKQKNELAKLSIVIALFRSICVEDMNQYLDCFDITYQNIGLLNDLKPLLTVSRIQGKEYYSFASVAYPKYVLERYREDLSDVIKNLIDYINQETEEYRKREIGIRKYKENDFAKFGINTSDKDVKQLQEELYERLYFYAYAVSIIYRFAADNNQLWNAITDEKTIDAIVVFLGEFNFEYQNLYGFGSGNKSSNPYDLCNELLADYIRNIGSDYISETIDKYVDYVLDSSCQLTAHDLNQIESFLNACSGIEHEDQIPLIDLIKNAAEEHRNITRFFWLLCFIFFDLDDNRGVYEAIDEIGLLGSFVDYKLETEIGIRVRQNTYPSVDFGGLLNSGLKMDKELEERILNTMLHASLLIAQNSKETYPEDTDLFGDWDKECITRYYKRIEEKGYNVFPDNYDLLTTIFPGFDTEPDEEGKITILNRKVKEGLLSYKETNDTIGEISELIHSLPSSSATSLWKEYKMIVETLAQIYDLAVKAAEQNELPSFEIRSGLYSTGYITELLTICADYHVFVSDKQAWEYWLRKLFQYDIDCLAERYYIGVREMKRLLFSLQKDRVFDERDPVWLFVMDSWICQYEASSMLINRPLKEKLILDDKILKNKLFCTNNMIKLLSIYLEMEEHQEKAMMLIQQLKDDVPFAFSKCFGNNSTFDRRLLRSLHRYNHAIEQYNELNKYLIDYPIKETASEQLKSIAAKVETYHYATDLTDPIIQVFDYYYEQQLFHDAIVLCNDVIIQMQSHEKKNNQSSMASQLSIALTVIRSFFAFVSNNEEDKVFANIDIDGETIYHNHVLPKILDSEDDGLITAIFYYQSALYDDRKEMPDPNQYKNNYLNSFFAGNGNNQIGPNYYKLRHRE